MTGLLAAAWPGLAQPGNWDFSPVGWALLILLAAWAAGGRLRWWGMLAALGGGLPCATIAARFGPLVALTAVATLTLVLRPVIRHGRRPSAPS